MNTRTRRLVRGWTGATIATLFAGLPHFLAGGTMPSPLLVLLSLSLSGPLCMVLAGRVLSRSGLWGVVLLSQGLHHALFAAAGSGQLTGASRHHGAHAHGIHSPELLETVPHSAGTGPAMMTGAHALAAVVTYTVLRHGEVTTVSLLQALRMRIRLLWRVPQVPYLPDRPLVAPAGLPHVLTDQSLLRAVQSWRGPPTPSGPITA